eukprot:gene10427-11344_t
MLLLWLLLLNFVFQTVVGDCSAQNDCNGHGACQTSTNKCLCYDGWGSENDISFYKAPDCSQRVCPAGKAWADIPTSATTAHGYMECSNRGVCDRASGLCKCFAGFTGAACDRTECPNDCSGHGSCYSIKQMARLSNALPLGPNTFYEGFEDSITWDEDRIFGCVCDSSWPVGLGAGEVQEPEWFGPDCSLRHCPSADNPRTVKDELDCSNVTAKNSIYRGEQGNLCQVDCANNGLCDYKTGTCKCFDGYYGTACAYINAQAVYKTWQKNANEDDD